MLLRFMQLNDRWKLKFSEIQKLNNLEKKKMLTCKIFCVKQKSEVKDVFLANFVESKGRFFN